MAKKTPLYDEHVKLSDKVVDYAGWFLPVEYKGLVKEHEAVREKVGMFDVSHMGEITIKGKDAEKYVDYLCTNDIKTLENGKIIYTFFCYEDGTVVDDLLVYKKSSEDLYLVVNASNTDKDYDWIIKNKGSFDVEIINESDDTGEVAVQGPLAQKTLQKLTDTNLDEVTFFTFKENVKIAGVNAMISRTGYTGEDGFEVYTHKDDIVKVWNEVLKAGEEFGIEPAGLGCRDTLRFEASLPLYGHEISDKVNPIDGGFKYFVKLDKESDFIGKEALKKYVDSGVKKKLIGLELKGRGIPREGYRVEKDGKDIGYITTGYMSPTLKKPIANVLVDVDAAIGDKVSVIIRNKPVEAELISKKFLQKK
ncbi:MAG: glycine cleavage system aminomethyltransferase GcvT [Tissierellia bacterium]|nr:glycine cleavage system aminomethyltransferase GcvT [Tissierellia bacterium]